MGWKYSRENVVTSTVISFCVNSNYIYWGEHLITDNCIKNLF